MILIIDNKRDRNVDLVIDWAIKKEVPFLRMGMVEFVSKVAVSYSIGNNKKDEIKLINHSIFDKITGVWIRDWNFGLFFNDTTNIFANVFNEELKTEHVAFFSSLDDLNRFGEIRWLSTFRSFKMNKLDIFKQATSSDLAVPKTLVTNRKSELLSFAKECENGIITKAIEKNFSYTCNDKVHTVYTKTLTFSDIEKLCDVFAISLFQEFVPIEYEVRVFFFDKKMFAMAIFSSAIEYKKHYNSSRFVPYKLPKDLERKLEFLIRKLDLNTGSIDLIFNRQTGEHYFLEVNPNGQFGFLSHYCNYGIEEKIVDYLSYEK